MTVGKTLPSLGAIGTGGWPPGLVTPERFQVPQERLEIIRGSRKPGVWGALRGAPGPTKGPTHLHFNFGSNFIYFLK